MKSLNFYITKLRDCSVHEAINLLRVDKDLSIEEKNLIYLYLFPRPLLDRQLPERVQSYRGSQSQGFLQPNIGEIGLFIEAYRTEQYRRFMKHLFHSFVDPEQLFPVAGSGQSECALCGKNLYNLDAWNDMCTRFPESSEKNKKEYLTFGSKNSNVDLCLDCIIQLKEASIILEDIEPGYLLDWRTKYKQPY